MRRGVAMGLFAAVILSARFYFHYAKPQPYKDGDTIRIITKVASEPVNYDDKQYLRIEGLKVYLPRYPEITYGDRVVVEGIVNTEKNRLDRPKLIETLPSTNFLYLFRNRLLEFYQSSFPSPHSGLVAGMVIGSKSGTAGEFYELLKNTGTAHVVVASGMNVSMISGFLASLFVIFLKRKKAIILAFTGIWLYALLAGFDAPVVRAAVMGSMVFLSQETGRLTSTVRILFISGMLMLIAVPEWVIDVGFWLSFCATLSLVIFEKRTSVYFQRVPSIIKEGLSTSVAAQIGVSPILLFAFGQFNLFSPLVNALVLWTVPPITIIGITGGLLGLVVPTLGRMVLMLIYPLTWWFIFVVRLFS